MFKTILKYCILACLFISISTPTFSRTITNDHGGRITKFQRFFRIAVKANVRYRIKGTCLSACTIYLGLPYVCVYPDALFGFHGAWPRQHDPKRQRMADKQMGQYLPPNLRRHYMEKWRHKNALSFEYRTGNQIVEMEPKIKLCSDV